MVCADLTEIGAQEIFSIAEQSMEKQVSDIAFAINDVAQRHDLDRVVACGLGEFLIKKAADRTGLDVVLISGRYGKVISKVFPAYAVAQLMERR